VVECEEQVGKTGGKLRCAAVRRGGGRWGRCMYNVRWEHVRTPARPTARPPATSDAEQKRSDGAKGPWRWACADGVAASQGALPYVRILHGGWVSLSCQRKPQPPVSGRLGSVCGA